MPPALWGSGGGRSGAATRRAARARPPPTRHLPQPAIRPPAFPTSAANLPIPSCSPSPRTAGNPRLRGGARGNPPSTRPRNPPRFARTAPSARQPPPPSPPRSHPPPSPALRRAGMRLSSSGPLHGTAELMALP